MSHGYPRSIRQRLEAVDEALAVVEVTNDRASVNSRVAPKIKQYTRRARHELSQLASDLRDRGLVR